MSSTTEIEENFRRYMTRRKVENSPHRYRLKVTHCVILAFVPFFLFIFVFLMGQYNRTSDPKVHRSLRLPEVISQSDHICQRTAIVYFFRNKTTTSFKDMIHSLELFHENYLQEFHDDTQLFLFHAGDLEVQDLRTLSIHLSKDEKKIIQFVNLVGTPYWQLPNSLNRDDPKHWRENENMEQLHENRFWSIKLWEYFDQVNRLHGCNFRHVLGIRQESFIYSPIKYNIFEYLESYNYRYGYRLCTYEMATADSLWEDYQRDQSSVTSTQRDHHTWTSDDCTFYNPFFVADIQFFWSPSVQRLLQFIDQGGYIYRDNISPSVIHTIALYVHASDSSIHRFLDFTIEHFHHNLKTKCPDFGAIQLGYNDINGKQKLQEWEHVYLTSLGCPKSNENKDASSMTSSIKSQSLSWLDLSVRHSHLPKELHSEVLLESLTAGLVN
jgi:Glycolipid 2-alpha-mannosyltransferase